MEGIMVSAATGVMNSVLTKLTTLLGEEYKLQKKVKRDVAFLKDELSSMNALLEKLANREVLDPQQKEWRNQVREMAYDIEDCIDDYMHQLHQDADKSNGIMGFFSNIIEKVKKLVPSHQFAEQMRELKTRIVEASQRRDRYKLDAVLDSGSNEVVPINPRLPARYVEASSLIGIDVPRDELIKLVDDGEKSLKVVSIVGFGGLGKTTLANQVYQKVGEQFDCRAFVSVSQKPDTRKILRSILSQIRKQEYERTESGDEECLINALRDFLKDKRYFIVIDDIWSTQAWKIIKCALLENTCGSRILVTTRIATVAKSCCSPRHDLVYELRPLSEGDSKSLFFRRVFGSEDKCPLQLKEVSTKIIRKCGGLPLAIITMSSLLTTKSHAREEWLIVLNSIGLGLEKNSDVEEMKKILSLSYNDLPLHLRTCLLYLSMFPEDYEIWRDRLVSRWIAEGFVKVDGGRNLMEEGECYFNELINRSMIQPVDIQHDGRVNACRVHDMILDLIISKAVEENFITSIGDQENCKIRRLSLDYRGQENVIVMSSVVTAHVRSLGIFGYSGQMPSISDFHVLRVLDIETTGMLENCNLENIGKLFQLRYLRIEADSITDLPEQIGELQYLETLDLYSTGITELPASIVKLRRLKRLLCRRVELPDGVGNMQALEELSDVLVDDESSINSLQELGNLTKLRTLHLDWFVGGSHRDTYADILASSLGKLCSSNLRCLGVDGDDNGSMFYSWSPPPILTLRELDVWCCYLIGIPGWMASLANLTFLSIRVNQVTQETFQILGDLAALLNLTLTSEADDPKERLVVCNGGFQRLKYFYFDSIMGLMFEAEAMPKLEEFAIRIVAPEVQSACGLGIHHLSALRKLTVDIDPSGARVEEVEAWKASIKNEASLHPNRPTPLFRIFRRPRGYNSIEEDHEDTESLEEDHEDTKQQEDVPTESLEAQPSLLPNRPTPSFGTSPIGLWGANTGTLHDIEGVPDRLKSVTICSGEVINSLALELLEKATGGFSEENKIGSGGYGKVYKGVLNGKEIAVKKLHCNLALDDVIFKNESENLMRIRHPNIVELVGYCHEVRHRYVEHKGKTVWAEMVDRALCFEYLQNGSLEKRLYEEHSGFDWSTRYKIIKGICEGLNYLHGLEESILHLDLKPANILLDENMVPKIADFGLSRLFGGTHTHITKNLVGTEMYMPPEYINNGVITKKYDVFSLGVIIIQIMTGREGWSKYCEMSSQQFIELVHQNWKVRVEATPMHTTAGEDCKQVKRCIEIALNCVETEREKRPTIGDIIHKLRETETMTHEVPKPFSQESGSASSSHFKTETVQNWSQEKQRGGQVKDSSNQQREVLQKQSGMQQKDSSNEQPGSLEKEYQEDTKKHAASGFRDEEMEVPITVSASGGTLRSLPGKLDSLLSEPQTRAEYELQQAEKDAIGHLKRDLEELISKYLIEPSEVEAPALTAERWVKEVRELSYDVDDFVDELIYDGANARISFARKTSRVKIAPLRKKLNPRGWITAEISGFRTRVEEMIQRHRSYHLDKCTMRKKWGDPDEGQLPLLHGVEAAHQLVDIDGSMKKLESMLLTDDGDGDQHKLKVVSITGFGGVGKTTLAKQLYSHLRGRFECRAFVRSSRKPDMRRLLTNMLSQLRRHQPVDAWEVPDLINNIRTHLQDKKYFIIIDDLWTLSAWDIVSDALTESNRCSRVLITTEVDNLAQACCGRNSDSIVTMEPLSEIGSRELFLSRVFGHEHECSEQINEVSCEIIRKCGGFPLAIIAAASLLANQPVIIDKWNYVQNSFSSNLRTNPTPEGMKQVLNLSYNNLPQRLKACMLYLSIYQEDYIIWKDDLVKQWNAEGFISEVEGKDIEEVAGSYFNELINKGMIQPVDINYNGEVLSCTVHYMVLNLVRYKSIEENFITAIDHSQTAIRLADKVRRLSLHFGNEEDATPPANMRLSQVRSLAFSGLFKCMPSINEFKLLRVLILKLWVDSDDTSYNLKEISKLFRLRYLCIDACHLSLELPAEMQQLKDLVTLEIDAKVGEVPSDIVHLHGLSHLRLPGETNLPDRIGHMTSLRTLGYYNLSSHSKDNVLNLGELANLWDLRLTCSVVLPDNLESNMQHLGSILGKLRNLKSLTLNTLDDAGATSMSISCDGLSSMSVPPALLERLEFSRRICTFSSLPRWIGKLNKLCILNIAVRELLRNGIDILKELPALTALSLYVRIAPSSILFDGAGFQLLKYFKFVCTAPCLAFVKGAMPNVRRLKLGFNANCMEQYKPERAGFEHLTGLEEISVKIGGAGAAGADAESVLMTAVSKHASNPRINVQLVDWNFYGDEDRSMSTREQEHMTPEEQDEILAYKYFGTQDEESGEVEKKQADSRISTLSESSSRLPVGDIKKVGSKPAIMTEDAMVSAFTGAMNSLLVKLATLLGEQYAKLTAGTRRKEFMILKDELDAMKTLLEQLAGMAELSAQMRDSRNQMREMTYDIEDCIDDLMLHNVTTLSNDLILMLQNFTAQIYKLKAQLEEADLRSMVPRTEMRSLGPSYMSREQWLSFDEGNGLVGMDGPRDELVRRLTGSGDEQDKLLQGVCILGVAGVGKTMLATQVYNEIKRRFDRCVFISASKKVDMARLCRSILLQLQETINSNRRNDVKNLIYGVRKTLRDKRFLIVIDGVWSAQIVEDIKAALPENNRGSRIITTSGISDVAESCGKHFSSFTYPMEPLTFEESLGLFRSIIFGPGRSCPVASEKVDEEIVKACGGIPLALRLIAGALASKPAEMEQWVTFREIMKQAGTDYHLNVEWMRKIFDISYSDLSCDMKTCLLYLSAFPENHMIRKDRLITRWVAEGFLLKRRGKTWWERGESYFLELVARNLVNPVYDEEDVLPIGCKVSGSVHDFITSLSSEENFVKSDVTDPTCMQHGVLRRLSVDLGSDYEEKLWDLLLDFFLSSKVRSLTFVDDFGFGWMLDLSAFKHVRVLDLKDNKHLENGQLESIGRLSLLSYLGLGGTNVTKLPRQIMALEQLTTLDIRRTRVRNLPAFRDTKLVFLLADELIIQWGMWGMQELEELSKVLMGPLGSYAYGVAGLVNQSRRLRMLGVRFSRWYAQTQNETQNEQEVKHFVEEVGRSNLQSLFLDNYPHHLLHLLADSWAHKRPHHLREIELRISGCLRLVPKEMASLIALTHLHINVEVVGAQGVRALGNLPNLVLLKLVCSDTGVPRLAVSSKDGFQCLKVFCYWSLGMGLQFEAGAMPQLRRLVLSFNVMETISKYADFDFGVQHLSYLVQVRATMDCLSATASDVEAAEANMRDQVSQNPNHPVLEWKTRQLQMAQ